MVEIDVKAAIKNETDNRIGNYSKTEVGSGTLTGDLIAENESPEGGNRSSVAKRKSPRRMRIRRQDISSTHTLDVSEEAGGATHSNASGGNNRIDPMLKL